MRNRAAARSLVLGALTALAVTTPVSGASAEGRALAGSYCTNPDAMPKPTACIQLSFEGQTAQGYTNSSDRTIDLRPGVYWLTVDDTSTAHNFSLEAPDGSDQDITEVADAPGDVTLMVNLTPGSWTLFCDPHRAMGMYVDIEVGGTGQTG
ncbi:MAG TPA: plastocyanin/azurin family copper-binding protein [Nocardioides sp.]|uniref:plastocyanin/azurin family copper-binding protein n=1 Tax=Nocardioides sp. TaxID=35761 RepID=UPI002F41F301